MTIRFNSIFEMILNEDLRKSVRDRENANMRSDRMDGYDDLATPFYDEDEVKAKGVIGYTHMYKEVMFYIDGPGVGTHAAANVLKYAAAHGYETGVNVNDVAELTDADLPMVDAAFAKTYRDNLRQDGEYDMDISEGTVKVVFSEGNYEFEKIPKFFMLGKTKMVQSRVVKHKSSGDLMVMYVPAGMKADNSQAAFKTFIQMIVDKIVTSEWYKRISDPKIFDVIYKFEDVSFFNEKALIEAGIPPETVENVKHIVRCVFGKGRFANQSLSDIRVVYRALSRAERPEDEAMVKIMEAAAEDLNAMLEEMFKGSEPGRFYTVDMRKKNFDYSAIMMMKKEGERRNYLRNKNLERNKRNSLAAAAAKAQGQTQPPPAEEEEEEEDMGAEDYTPTPARI